MAYPIVKIMTLHISRITSALTSFSHLYYGFCSLNTSYIILMLTMLLNILLFFLRYTFYVFCHLFLFQAASSGTFLTVFFLFSSFLFLSTILLRHFCNQQCYISSLHIFSVTHFSFILDC